MPGIHMATAPDLWLLFLSGSVLLLLARSRTWRPFRARRRGGAAGQSDSALPDTPCTPP
jgi:hypothetical protein